MKDKRVFFNPIRMLSPKLDSEATKIEELYQTPVSESFTLEEGLLVMVSKLIEMTRSVHRNLMDGSPEEMEGFDQLAKEVHQQEKMLTSNLACTLTDPPEICRIIVMFPGRLERMGDYLESIANCCRIKARDAVPFTERAVFEIDEAFKLLFSTMTNFRDVLVRPNKFLLEHVIAEAGRLDDMCQDWQFAHVDRLLDGSTAPRASSLYLDILESTQSLNRHLKEMAKEILGLLSTVEEAD